MRTISLYVHVPFCKRRCPYCTFYHVSHIDSLQDRFVDSLVAELEAAVEDIGEPFECPTVFFGGGTPSVLRREMLGRVFESLVPYLADNVEVTLETNPEDVSDELFAQLREIGVNRLSLGVQSMQPDALRTLNRCSLEKNRRALATARRWFENYNVDLLVGIPDASLVGMRDTLDRVLEYEPSHLSIYCLEPGGAMESDRSFFDRVEDERSVEEYLDVCETLRSSGYVHYEISNFARPRFESRHNRVYWRGGDYLGVGPGAHSSIAGERFYNEPSIERYISQKTPLAIRRPDARGGMARHLEDHMLALRTSDGLPMNRLGCATSVVDDLVAEGLAREEDGHLVLTDRGFLVLNEIVLRVASPPKPASAGH